MKILVVSDTHGRDTNFRNVLEKEKPIDALIHLGDIEGSERYVPDWVNPGCRVAIVLGNNDFFSYLDREIEMELGPHRLLLTHGHYYGVSLGVDRLRNEALTRGCDIAMYGHTHRPYLEEGPEVTILNPGSLSYPRQEGRRPSYMVLNMDENGAIDYETFFL